MITAMPNLIRIYHNGQLAAIVIAGQAIIEDTIPDDDYRHVQAMCLYALELEHEGRADQYTESDAHAYAAAALASASVPVNRP